MATPRLSAATLIPLLLASLPHETSPALKSPWDALALLCHACLLSVDFRLIGLGEDHRIDATSEVDSPQPLPAEWNGSRSSDYAFRYKHPQSSMEYLLKISKLGGRVVISGLGLGDDRVRSFDVPAKDFASESAFPYTREAGADDAQVKSALTNLFISESRITDFAALIKLNIIQVLLPGLQKAGYEDAATRTATASQSARERRDPERGDREAPSRRPPEDLMPPYAQPRPPFHDPLAVPPRRPVPAGDFPPPGFEDEHEILAPRNRGGYGPPRMPLSGERDLYPPGMGPNDPLRVGPGGGPRGGGMYPAADDPMFGGDGGGSSLYDDRAPPGARYDPIGPFDGPPNLRGGRFPGGGRGGNFGGGGGPPNPFSGFGSGDFI